MKRMISGILVGSLVFAAAPVWAADNDNLSAPSAPVAQARFRASMDHALTAIVNAPPDANQVQPGTRLSETKSGRVHRSEQAVATSGSGGGSHVGLIIGLLTTVAGIAGTVYMVKAMKKATDQATAQAKQ
jgi:hypothetical protein